MRIYLIILFLILISCQSDKIDKEDLDSFSNVEIRLLTGDEKRETYSMNIYKDGEKIKASRKRPFYYYGSETDSIWITEIDKSDLRLLNQFINKAKSMNDSCPFNSSSLDRYSIKTVNQEIKIVGNCDWDEIDYDSLESKIFANNFIELKKKRKVLTDSLIKSFEGMWDVSGWKNGVLEDKKIVLTRISENEPEKIGYYRWKFVNTDSTNFKNNLDIDEGSTLINIKGSMYKIIEIKNEQIKLKFLW